MHERFWQSGCRETISLFKKDLYEEFRLFGASRLLATQLHNAALNTLVYDPAHKHAEGQCRRSFGLLLVAGSEKRWLNVFQCSTIGDVLSKAKYRFKANGEPQSFVCNGKFFTDRDQSLRDTNIAHGTRVYLQFDEALHDVNVLVKCCGDSKKFTCKFKGATDFYYIQCLFPSKGMGVRL